VCKAVLEIGYSQKGYGPVQPVPDSVLGDMKLRVSEYENELGQTFLT